MRSYLSLKTVWYWVQPRSQAKPGPGNEINIGSSGGLMIDSTMETKQTQHNSITMSSWILLFLCQLK